MPFPRRKVVNRSQGKAPDLGDVHYRSKWERNVARYLNELVRRGLLVRVTFEEETMWFPAVSRGVRSYTPDFKCTRPDGTFYYVEVKGWMDPKSKTKLKRAKLYYPDREIQVVNAATYNKLCKAYFRVLPHWEA